MGIYLWNLENISASVLLENVSENSRTNEPEIQFAYDCTQISGNSLNWKLLLKFSTSVKIQE